ncbi:cytochrome P450 [Venturia nashicola]|uniref:Cytochrome P450 n=1 Tax=Venturia nashicola TaxID=86259 RepID=A0A4Z1PHW2_9PEZI|nr:cytochrome P450 [Venturia nashicola]
MDPFQCAVSTNSTTATVIALGFLSGLIGIYLIQRAFGSHDPREPPIIRSWIPIIGHIGALLVKGNRHFTHLCQQYKYPIFTVPLLNGSKIYVVASPAVAAQVQRNQKTMTFDLMATDFSIRMTGLGPEVRKLLEADFTSKDKIKKDGCFLNTMHHHFVTSLGPGGKLDDIALVQLNAVAKSVGNLATDQTVDLFVWIRQTISMASMLALYGPKNIFETHPELEECFCQWESDLPLLMTGFMPSLLAPTAQAAVERIKRALVEYAEKVFNRRQNLSYQIMHGVLANVTPTAFWLLTRLYTTPSLLSTVRYELEQSDIVRIDGMDRFISISKLKKRCPSLSSAFRECLRYYAFFTDVRMITEDTVIDGNLLKKGHVTQICLSALHSDPEIWGSDVDDFDALRFVTTPFGTIKSLTPNEPSKNVHAAAFRGFGGGRGLCPGRHLARAETTGFAALIVLGWDLQSDDGTELKMPRIKEVKIPSSVAKPDRDLKVSLRRRKGLENVQWSFEL